MTFSSLSSAPTVLITGGCGFIGGHLARHWLSRGAKVRVIDNLRSGNPANLEGCGVDFFQASILDRKALAQAMAGVDFVFHLAAMVSVPESMDAITECIELNSVGIVAVLEEAARAGVRRVVHSSSAAVYGESPEVPKIESLPPDPRSPYAITKLDGEYYADLFRRTGRVDAVSLRYFNVFGPRQNPRSAYAAAVPIFIEKALQHQPLLIHGDGGQTRDFVYVEDVAAANAFVATHSDAQGTYNVGYGQSITIRELAEKIVSITGSPSEIQYGAPRPGDVRHSLASPQRLFDLGFRPTGTFDQGLTTTVQWFQKAKTD
jgi:UDP-glucose 4-epimerase